MDHLLILIHLRRKFSTLYIFNLYRILFTHPHPTTPTPPHSMFHYLFFIYRTLPTLYFQIVSIFVLFICNSVLMCLRYHLGKLCELLYFLTHRKGTILILYILL